MTERYPLSAETYGPYKGRHPKQLIVLLHGPDAKPGNMRGFAEAMEPHFPHAKFLAPEAPYGRPAHPDRRYWTQHAAHNNEELLDGLREVAPSVDAYLDAAKDMDGLSEKDVALVGFSEGALVALHVGLRRAANPAGILCFSGCVVGAKELKDEITAHPPVYLIQGDEDPGLPVHVLPDSIGELMKLGIRADSHLCRGMGHTINKEAVNRGAKFLTRILRIPRNPTKKKPKADGAAEPAHEGLWHRLLHPHSTHNATPDSDDAAQ